VIWFTTVTLFDPLFEMQPGLGATRELADTTVHIVGDLVFGEIYDAVFAKVRAEHDREDAALAANLPRHVGVAAATAFPFSRGARNR